MAKYDYRCPNCGQRVELRKRATQTKRRCSYCNEPITTHEIDRQIWQRWLFGAIGIGIIVVIALVINATFTKDSGSRASNNGAMNNEEGSKKEKKDAPEDEKEARATLTTATQQLHGRDLTQQLRVIANKYPETQAGKEAAALHKAALDKEREENSAAGRQKKAQDEKDAEALMRATDTSYLQGKYEEVRKALKEIVAKYPDTKAGHEAATLLAKLPGRTKGF
jgi:DNA-directed RNA polymerase subunit RPC12/RpoP